MQGHGARVTASFLGLGRKSSVGGRRHGKGQLGSGGLAGGLNFPPRDWEADKGFKTAVTAWGWAFGEDDANVGKRYDLPYLNPVGEDGKYLEGPWAGTLVFDADKEVIAYLKEKLGDFLSDKTADSMTTIMASVEAAKECEFNLKFEKLHQ